MGPYGPEKSKKERKIFAFIGDFKVKGPIKGIWFPFLFGLFGSRLAFYMNMTGFDGKCVFWIPRQNTFLNDYKITSKSKFWTRSVRN